jgi:flavin-dependent dehydrogenase
MEVRLSSFDLAVIGGGPAGASAAITAARTGASVGLFDVSDFPRQKVCGEFVSAESLELLRDLLREHPRAEKLLGDAPVISQARIFVSGSCLQTAIEPPALSIPRYALDLLLWESAQQAGARVHKKCEVLSVEGHGPFTLTTALGTASAKAVILCVGRWSRFSDAADVPPGPKWIGVKAHYREASPSPSTDLYFFDQGYCGVQPVAPGAVNVCAMVRSDAATTLSEVLQLSRPLARRSAGWQPLTPVVSTAPLIYRKPQAVRDNLLLAGDAAGFIDPFVGDGISLALRGGQAAANCLQSFLADHTSLDAGLRNYESLYGRQFAPLIAAATLVRSLVSLPEIVRLVALQVLRIPGVLPYVIRKTRAG